MAILRYFSYFSPQYRKALEYVIYRHDEETKEPILDINGKRLRREDFLIDGLNCTPLSFPMTAKLLNDRFRKNQEPGRERFMGQYIISYNPKDKEEGLLDTQRAHELSMRFIRECFPGLVGIACTHGDGDHHAGNIHTHFYFCTVKCSSEISSTMKYPETSPMGDKFKPSPATMREYREKLAELVAREGLHPDNLLGISGDRISNGEYWIRDYYQKKLDEKNRQIREEGGIPEYTVFYTEKQLLRIGIRDTVVRHTDFEQFRDALLKQYEILITTTGREWRYEFFFFPMRSYSAVTLGQNYRKDTILETLRRNKEDPSRIMEYLKGEERRLFAARDELPDPDSPEACLAYLRRKWTNPYAERLGIAACAAVNYQGGETRFRILRLFPGILHFIEKMMIRSREELLALLAHVQKRIPVLKHSIKSEQGNLRSAQNLRYWGDVLRKGRDLRAEMETSSDPEMFRKEHEGELLEFHHAEEILADGSDASKETLWKNVQKSLREIRDLQSELNQVQETEEECRVALQGLDDLDLLLEQRPQLRDQIRKTLEDREPKAVRVTKHRTEAREERISSQEKHLIPRDYER